MDKANSKKTNFLNTFVTETRACGIVPSMYVNSSYCMSVKDNIFTNELSKRFEMMYINGNGNELSGKACAVNSSSMFAYNFFHWISEESPLFFLNNSFVFNKVYFEVQLPTLRGTTPANMDVVLEGERMGDGKKTLLFH